MRDNMDVLRQVQDCALRRQAGNVIYYSVQEQIWRQYICLLEDCSNVSSEYVRAEDDKQHISPRDTRIAAAVTMLFVDALAMLKLFNVSLDDVFQNIIEADARYYGDTNAE